MYFLLKMGGSSSLSCSFSGDVPPHKTTISPQKSKFPFKMVPFFGGHVVNLFWGGMVVEKNVRMFLSKKDSWTFSGNLCLWFFGGSIFSSLFLTLSVEEKHLTFTSLNHTPILQKFISTRFILQKLFQSTTLSKHTRMINSPYASGWQCLGGQKLGSFTLF